jgi:plasmid stability protein
MHVLHMAKMIQIRHVPDSLHRQLRVRAARAGMSLSDFLRVELEQSLKRMTMEELWEKLDSLEPVSVSESPAQVIRRFRGK